MTIKYGTDKVKSPESVIAEIEALKASIEAKTVELKESKRASITEAVRKGGEVLDTQFKEYVNRRKLVQSRYEQLEKLQAEIKADMVVISTQYKQVRDGLVLAGAKEEYLAEFIGEPPAEVKAAAVSAAGSGTGKGHRTKAKMENGSTISWTDLLKLNNIPHADKNSAHREWDEAKAKNPNLANVTVVTE